MKQGAIRGLGLTENMQLSVTKDELHYVQRIADATDYTVSQVARILLIEAIARRVIDTRGKDLPVGANGKPRAAGRRV